MRSLTPQEVAVEERRKGSDGATMAEISKAVRAQLLRFQRNEITEHRIYSRLARRERQPANRATLERIAGEELRHYGHWKALTGRDVRPSWWRVFTFCLVSRLLGFTFAVKIMERGENGAQDAYGALGEEVEGAAAIARDEHEHEDALIAMLDEERLRYAGSMVLGLNDALVELTGALAGLTFALQRTRLVALTGLITGIAAALSMAASEYLSTKSDESDKSPVKAALYTGSAYVVTVALLILPFLVLEDHYVALGCTLGTAVLIIGLFNYYIAVAKDLPFGARFAEMAGLSLGVAGLSFGVGYLVRAFLGVEV
jgi:VIT1/CCC1 family predicted Fe2+/Mn2+ transporter